MPYITQLVVLATTASLCICGAKQQACTAKVSGPDTQQSSSLLQQSTVRAAQKAALREDRGEPPKETPVLPPAHELTLEEKLRNLADVALAETAGTSAAETVAKEVKEVLSDPKQNEKELQDLEVIASENQDTETLTADGADLTIDNLAQVDGENEEEAGGHFQGDIMIEGDSLLEAKASRWNFPTLWTDAKMPYCFASDVGEDVKAAFKQALARIKQHLPCMTFEEVGHVKGNSLTQEWWLTECEKKPSVFVKSQTGSGCWSYVGMVASRSQQLQLASPGCLHVGIVIHEILHALGYWHEHQRTDRDTYIDVHYNNILPGYENQFTKDSEVYRENHYDFESIMHYGAFAFDVNGLPTITLKDGSTENIGNRLTLAETDVQQLEVMYKKKKDSCKARFPIGHGCKDVDPNFCSTTLCNEIARDHCCKCGGGELDLCFADGEPCSTPPAVLTGAEAPYPGWLSAEGSLTDWKWETVAQGMKLCEEESNCQGIAVYAEADQAMSGAKAWMKLKNHFRIGGTEGSGWTSFKRTVET